MRYGEVGGGPWRWGYAGLIVAGLTLTWGNGLTVLTISSFLTKMFKNEWLKFQRWELKYDKACMETLSSKTDRHEVLRYERVDGHVDGRLIRKKPGTFRFFHKSLIFQSIGYELYFHRLH